MEEPSRSHNYMRSVVVKLLPQGANAPPPLPRSTAPQTSIFAHLRHCSYNWRKTAAWTQTNKNLYPIYEKQLAICSTVFWVIMYMHGFHSILQTYPFAIWLLWNFCFLLNRSIWILLQQNKKNDIYLHFSTAGWSYPGGSCPRLAVVYVQLSQFQLRRLR